MRLVAIPFFSGCHTMTLSTLTRARALTINHLSAFKLANPGKELPQLTYERGWFVFRYRITGGTSSRVRGAELEKMTGRLLDRAIATLGDDNAG